MKKILIVDDEIAIRKLIQKYATMHNFEVFEAGNGQDALDLTLIHSFDIIVLDVMMPYLNGYEVCAEIRKTSDVPIIMLTAKDGELDKFQGFDLGVDDYIVKPFSPRELMYRIEAILKRGKSIHTDVYTYKGLKLNRTARCLSIDDTNIELAPKEYDLLAYFIRNKGIALERNQLIDAVWGYDFDGDERTLDTHIKRLRKKMGEYQNTIITIRGVGYRYDEI